MGEYIWICFYIEAAIIIVLNDWISLKSANNIEGTPYSKMQGEDHQSAGSSVVTHSKSRHLVVLNNLKKRVLALY